MWEQTVEINGLQFSMTGSRDCNLLLSREQVEAAGERLCEITEWFLENGDEFGLIEWWRESGYEKQYFSPSELRTIAGSSFASEEEKNAVFASPRKEIPPKRAKPKRPGYIYVIRAENGTYKIGKSVNAQGRITALGVILPFSIVPIHVIESEDMNALERELHKRFEEKKVNGEWFNLTPEDISFLKSL